jgi:hypothetical protein
LREVKQNHNGIDVEQTTDNESVNVIWMLARGY